jgi:4-amino-4-deoxy-L-arabinose transferase-like glycosyltransferase
VVLIVLLGVGLRSYQLDYNFDGDEIFSVRATSGSLGHLFRVALEDVSHPPLYYLVLHAWLKCFGASEAVVRLPSIVFSVFFLASLLWAALRVASYFSALLAMLLCSVSPFFVFYGEQARPYALAAFLAALSLALMLEGMRQASSGWALLYGITTAALVYTQYLGLLVLLPQFVLLACSRMAPHRRLLLGGSLGALSIVGWLSLLAAHLGERPAARIQWIGRPELVDLLRFFLGLCGYLNLDGSTRILILLYVLALAGLFLRRQIIRSPTALLVNALALLGPVALWIASRFGPFSIWAPRQLIGAAAFFFVLIGMGLGEYRRGIRYTAAALLVLWCLLTVPTEFPSHSRPPWRSIAAVIDSEPPDTAVVASEAFILEPLAYYSRRVLYSDTSPGGAAGHASRYLLLCRPSYCPARDELARRHRLVREGSIDWVRYAATPTSTLKTYLFER